MSASSPCVTSTGATARSLPASVSRTSKAGKKAWVPLDVTTTAQAQEELRRVLVEREDQTLRHVGESPTLETYYTKSYLPILLASGKNRTPSSRNADTFSTGGEDWATSASTKFVRAMS